MNAGRKIRVLIVDDSQMVRNVLQEIITQDPDLEVAGLAENGLRGVELCAELRPDVITMDVQMPEMDGFQATERIMAYTPTPILILSSALDQSQQYTSFQAISLGALDVMAKPDLTEAGFQGIAIQLRKKIKMLAKIRVIHHIRGKLSNLRQKSVPRETTPVRPVAVPDRRVFSMVVIGASTGGPVALEKILSQLPQDFPLPLAVVQHITSGFIGSFVDWLNSRIKLRARQAQDREEPLPGNVYFAPDGAQLILSGGRFLLDRNAAPWGEHKPSVNHLFTSAAESIGRELIAVLLTGMGSDGAEGMKKIQHQRGLTIAQDRHTSLIYGMPRAAVELGAVEMLMPLERIPEQLIKSAARN